MPHQYSSCENFVLAVRALTDYQVRPITLWPEEWQNVGLDAVVAQLNAVSPPQQIPLSTESALWAIENATQTEAWRAYDGSPAVHAPHAEHSSAEMEKMVADALLLGEAESQALLSVCLLTGVLPGGED